MNTDRSGYRLYRFIQTLNACGRTTEKTHLRLHLVAFFRRLDFDDERLDLALLVQRHIINRQSRVTELAFPSQTTLLRTRIP